MLHTPQERLRLVKATPARAKGLDSLRPSPSPLASASAARDSALRKSALQVECRNMKNTVVDRLVADNPYPRWRNEQALKAEDEKTQSDL